MGFWNATADGRFAEQVAYRAPIGVLHGVQELAGDGTSFATGTDFLEFDEQGRIADVTGYLDRAPDGFDHHDN
ncbi:hypothetical protein [Kribbella sp. NPDC048928]|uniref:hypothetical protein n=1 Tax=Kribbella sp. NPDC048928 TaxID=3364111 RepID=UPI003712BA38